MKKKSGLTTIARIGIVVLFVTALCWLVSIKSQLRAAADSAGSTAPPSGAYAPAPTPLDTGNYLLGAYFFPYWHSPGSSITNWLLMNAYYSSQSADHTD